MKQPCDKNCAGRSAECHSTCEKWAEYEAERNKIYEERKKTGDVNSMMREIERKRKADIATGRMRARRSRIK